MTGYGIWTTDALFGVHLHPREAKIYCYRVSEMRVFLRKTNPPVVPTKRQFNGEPTGRGYKVDKAHFFIKCKTVPDVYLRDVDWPELTDREKGFFHGETVVLRLCNDDLIFPGAAKPFSFLNDRHGQYSGIDIVNGQLTLDVKTEGVISTNLFIQIEEQNHQVNIAPDGSFRKIEIPDLTDNQKSCGPREAIRQKKQFEYITGRWP